MQGLDSVLLQRDEVVRGARDGAGAVEVSYVAGRALLVGENEVDVRHVGHASLDTPHAVPAVAEVEVLNTKRRGHPVVFSYPTHNRPKILGEVPCAEGQTHTEGGGREEKKKARDTTRGGEEPPLAGFRLGTLFFFMWRQGSKTSRLLLFPERYNDTRGGDRDTRQKATYRDRSTETDR